jgi:gliding motility-associated lipoprotein GldH
MKRYRLIVFIFAAFVLSACTKTGVFERITFFSKHEWKSEQKPSFSFNITDTTSLYKVYLVLRHTDAYRWKNIWLNITLKAPDTTVTIKREFILSDSEKWLGTTVDDIVEQRIPFDIHPAPFKKGNYTFTLQQVMREDPLQNVLNAGIRVEKQQ